MMKEMNTLEKFKEDVAWSMLELSDEEVEMLYNSVDKESYSSMEELEEDYDLEEDFVIWDVDLVSVLDYFKEWINKKEFYVFSLYYLEEEEVYVGVFD